MLRFREVPQPVQAEVHQRRLTQVVPGELGGRGGEKDLPAMTHRHHPCAAVQRGAIPISRPLLGVTDMDADPNAQFADGPPIGSGQRSLGGDRDVDRRRRGVEPGDDAVARVLEQLTASRHDGIPDEPVMTFQGRAHALRK